MVQTGISKVEKQFKERMKAMSVRRAHARAAWADLCIAEYKWAEIERFPQ